MGFEWCASVRGFGPASAAILASAALGAGLTVLAGAGPTAAAVHPAVAPHASARLAAGFAAPDGTISTVAGASAGRRGLQPASYP
jgi:tRNA U34 5-methylaminomethyl-2-thiouridine-forming methyltransferase MnmC